MLSAKLESSAGAAPGVLDRITFFAGNDSRSFALVDPVTQDDITKQATVEARIDLGQDIDGKGPFPADKGLIGFRPSVATDLAAVRIVVRVSERDGYASSHPFFAIHLDWIIEAGTDGASNFADGSVEVTAGAAVELIVATGFSAIYPPGQHYPQLGAAGFQLRIDLDFMAATTGWFPLPLIDIDGLSAFEMPGFGTWWAALAGLDLAIPFPDWIGDFRLPLVLPLGLSFRESHLIVERPAGQYRLTALAKGLVVAWKGDEVFTLDDVEFSLRTEQDRYIFKAQLFRTQYPARDTVSPPAYRIALPFDALGLTCLCWQLKLGMFAHQDGSGNVRFCPELVVELAGIGLHSALASGNEPLWSAKALRLHMRDAQLLTCAAGASGQQFFAGAEGDIFGPYRNILGATDGLSDVWPADGGPADDPGEDLGISFEDGAFDPEGHGLLIWKQKNDRLLRRFMALAPGLDRREPAETDEAETRVALEFARFARGNETDHQIRLEWRGSTTEAEAVDHGGTTAPAAAPPPAVPGLTSPGEHCIEPQADGTLVLTLPVDSDVTFQPIADPDIRLRLPLIDVCIARPEARSLLLYKPARDDLALSFLHIYPAGDVAIASAEIGFSTVTSDADGRDRREPMPTRTTDGADAPFIKISLAAAGQAQALAVIAWQAGRTPKLLQAYDGSAEPFLPLLSDEPVPGGQDPQSCPRPAPPRRPPVALAPARFRTPDFGATGGAWRFYLQVAESALFSLFNQGGENDPIRISVTRLCYRAEETAGQILPPLYIHTDLVIQTDFTGKQGDEIRGEAVFRFDPADMSLRLVEGGRFELKLKILKDADGTPGGIPEWVSDVGLPDKPEEYWFSEAMDRLGLETTFYRRRAVQTDDAAPAGTSAVDAPPETLGFLQLDLSGGRFAISLSEGCSAFMRYDGLGGSSLNFNVDRFVLGPGGLDVEARLIRGPLKVKGLVKPFMLRDAQLSIEHSRVRRLSIGADGLLPDILSGAPVDVSITLSQKKDGGPIELDELVCELGNKDKPLFSSGVRYRFDIEQIDLRYVREGGADAGRHFFFEITGKAQFVPQKGEFSGGLLENLKSATIEFTRAPLSDEFTDYLTFSVELRKPITFSVFKVFRMEIRSFGFAPAFAFPGGTREPALIIGGQCQFADDGDVISAEIDFHKMYIGMPKRGEAVPQVSFDNLRVEIQAADGFRIGGTIRTYDEPTIKGFKGDGFVAIPGLPELGAAFAFMQLRHPGGEWKRAWFIAVEAGKISYQVPPLPIYLRQVGLGFGYRMTSVLLGRRPEGETIPQFIDAMLKNLDTHQTLARIESWTEDLEQPGESPPWTVAIEGVLTLGTSQSEPFNYEAKRERKLRTIVVQLIGALRSDLSMVAASKVWLPISVDDFFEDRDNMRRRPLAKGFIHYAPRQQRLVAYATKGQDVYYGDPEDSLTKLMKTILDPMPFEFAALIEPSRVRGEIGWADRLLFPLRLGPIDLECRGGLLFAVEKSSVIHGLYFSARGKLNLEGGAGGGSVGLSLSARADVNFAVRLLIAQRMIVPIPSNIYGQVGIDINVRLTIHAWLRLKLGFVKIKIDIKFSIDIQIIVAVEFGLADSSDLGFKGRATVVIGVFGRRLCASIAIGIREGAVDKARRELSPYMSSFLEPGKIPPVPGDPHPADTPPPAGGGRPVGRLAETRRLIDHEPVDAFVRPHGLPGGDDAGPSADPADLRDDGSFAFTVVEAVSATPGKRRWILWIMPAPQGDSFYPVPSQDRADPYARLTGVPMEPGCTIFALDAAGAWTAVASGCTLYANGAKSFPVDPQSATDDVAPPLLRQMIAGCYVPATAGGNFPFDFGTTSYALVHVTETIEARPVEDSRVADGPRHADPILNPGLDYDRQLARVLDEKPEEPADPKRQALGNQGFLLQSFQQNVQALAADSGFRPGDDEPSLFDTGMMLVLEGDSLPDWVRSRSMATARPSIQFDETVQFPDGVAAARTFALRPMVEPESIRFADGGVGIEEPPIIHFDEERLAIHWRLAWKNGRTPRVAEGVGSEVEDFLSHYRIELFDLDGIAEKPMLERLVRPMNLLVGTRDAAVTLGDGPRTDLTQLRPRYNFTVPVSDIFGPSARGLLVLRQIMAVITPVSQAGDEGASFTVTARQEPRLTPLPAQEAHCALRYETGKLRCVLSWNQPPLPSLPGIATTASWELVIRKLSQPPLGHYPRVSGSASDEAGQLAADRTLKAGDLILRIPMPSGVSGEDGSEHFAMTLTPGNAAAWVDQQNRPVVVTWHDHLGDRIDPQPSPSSGTQDPPNHYLQALRDSFMKGVSLYEADGHAWQLFLRARSPEATDPANPTGKPLATCSTMSAVRLAALLADKSDTVLPHLEWPRPPVATWSMSKPVTGGGPLHVPLWRGGASGDQADFARARGRRRVLSVRWPGFASAAGRLESVAAFHVEEASTDGMLNADFDDYTDEFAPRWVETGYFDAADPETAGQMPASLSDTQNWQCWSPAEAAILNWLDAQKAGFDRDSALGWYGWSDATLDWPVHWERPPALASPEPAPPPPDEAEVFLARESLHPFLRDVLLRLHRAAAAEGLNLDVATGLPVQNVATMAAWMDQCSPTQDPYGWAALWHLGLGVELSLRDRVTRLPVAQADLVARCRKAVVAALNDLPEDLRKGVENHCSLDLPIRPNDALAAEPRSTALAEIALDRILLSLRPIATPTDAYCVVKIAKGRAGNADLTSSIVLHYLGYSNADAAHVEGKIDLASGSGASELQTIIDQSRLVLLKFPIKIGPDNDASDGWPWIKRLLEAMNLVEGEHFWHVPRPLAINGDNVPAWPHGMFDDREPDDGGGEPFERFQGYVRRADWPERDRSGEVKTFPEGDLPTRYKPWAARFFATAPIVNLRTAAVAAPGSFGADTISTIAPLAETVELICADGQGNYHFNRAVNLQWANGRLVRITAIGRYDRLMKAMAQPQAAMVGAAAGVYLPRVRKVEPPQPLGERIVTDAFDGRAWHEMTFATHSEDALQKANVKAARQLEYLGTQRRYERSFRWPQWVMVLEGYDPSHPDVPLPPGFPILANGLEFREPTIEMGEWVPDFAESERNFLQLFPAARFGARSYLTPAEPYYFTTRMDVQAIAAAERSASTQLLLATPSPGIPSNPALSSISVAWAAEHDYWDDRKPLYESWRTSIGADVELLAALRRPALMIAVRLPRYFESLSGQARIGEDQQQTHGTLPDHAANVQVTRTLFETDDVLVAIQPNGSFNDIAPFALRDVAPDIATFGFQIRGADRWWEGLTASFGCEPKAVRLATSEAGLVIASVPVATPDDPDFMEPDRIPATGRLAWCAPLALRLQLIDATTLCLANPVALTRRMVRPLTASGAGDMTAHALSEDIGHGLRLLLDAERLAAAKHCAYPEADPFDPLLADAIETSPVAAVRAVGPGQVDPGIWTGWVQELVIWGREQSAAPGWSELRVPPDTGNWHLIAVVREDRPAWHAAMEGFLTLGGDAADGSGVTRIARISADCAALGTLIAQRMAEADSLQTGVGGIAAWVQRGNAPRVSW